LAECLLPKPTVPRRALCVLRVLRPVTGPAEMRLGSQDGPVEADHRERGARVDRLARATTLMATGPRLAARLRIVSRRRFLFARRNARRPTKPVFISGCGESASARRGLDFSGYNRQVVARRHGAQFVLPAGDLDS